MIFNNLKFKIKSTNDTNPNNDEYNYYARISVTSDD
jgi:hypothetical protein